MNPEQKENVLIVDDVISNLVILTEIIKKAGYVARPVTDVHQAMEAVEALLPDLILLDVTMPEIDGFEYCQMLKKDVRTRNIPVIFISAATSPEMKEKGFSMGAVDFIIKPFETQEVYLRVNTHLKLYRMQRELENYNRQLQKTINAHIRRMNEEQRLVMLAMAKLVEGRDSSDSRHVENIGKNARLVALSLQFSPKFTKLVSNEFVETIELAAPLHDIGKMRIPDSVLLKPGKLTDEEMEIMKTHSKIGADTLENIYNMSENNEAIGMAIDIAKSHHERWDGMGYPDGLKGTEIPLSARITSIVDVYDVLISDRCYKKAYTHEKAMEIINNDAGKSFDPDIVEVFNKIQKQLRR